MTNIEPILWRNALGEEKWQPRIDNEKLWKNPYVTVIYVWCVDEEAHERQSENLLSRLHPLLCRSKRAAERESRRELKKRAKRDRENQAYKREKFEPAGAPDPRFNDPSKPHVPEPHEVEPGDFWLAHVNGHKFIGTRSTSGRWYGVAVHGGSAYRVHENAVTLLKRVKPEVTA